MRILGIDPGLQCTGFGVIDTDGAALHYVASGTIQTSPKDGALLPERLKILFDGISEVVKRYQPEASVCEIVFVNVNPQATLLLGQARGCCLTALVANAVPTRRRCRKWSNACCSCPACPARTRPTPWAWPSPMRRSAARCRPSTRCPPCRHVPMRPTKAAGTTENRGQAVSGQMVRGCYEPYMDVTTVSARPRASPI